MNILSKFKNLRTKVREKRGELKTREKKDHRPKWLRELKESERYQKTMAFINKYSIIMHIPLSMAMIFAMEWMSRHSFLDACEFVADHTMAFLYNSYIVFVVFTLVYLGKRRTFARMVISALFVALGIINCIILLNRVSPFGYTDIAMVGDLLTMQNTNYFSASQGALAVVAIVIYALLMVRLFRRGKKQEPKLKFWQRAILVLIAFVSLPGVTYVLQEKKIIDSYFGNLAQGYSDNGYLYGFASSTFSLGMSKPRNYNEETVQSLVADTDQGETTISAEDTPNIIVVLLESYYDVAEDSRITTSEDPTPFTHYLEENYSTGHLTVPVVGAGTCDTEFEVLTGMSMQFFGPGEYPQKTILKQTDVESYVSDISTTLGLGTHVVHDNGGNFYSRRNAFSMMGFDTFQSKEMLDITEYTPLGSWPLDDILIGATTDALDTTEGSDFVYTITVQTHGDYPTYAVEGDDTDITTTVADGDESLTNQWTYYVNRISDMDQWIEDYVNMLSERDEDTLLIMFGDHLPTLGIQEDEIATGDLYQTKYYTWNNFGMEKEDKDLTSYQLLAEYTNRLGIHGGTIMNYNQEMLNEGVEAGSDEYMDGLELLQYDLLYGDRYAYGGVDLYPASDLVMGVKDITISGAYLYNGKLHIYGDNFTKWSRVYINGEKVSTTYESGQVLTIDADDIENGDTIVVNQLGSSNTIFRSSNEYTFYDPNYEEGEDAETTDDDSEPTNEKNE